MRQPRDFDAELKALDDKAKNLKERKLGQLGELVIATGADALPVDELAGALLGAVGSADYAAKEACRKRGAAFFRPSTRKPTDEAGGGASGGKAISGGAQPPAREARAA